jgi:hypothetical protein
MKRILSLVVVALVVAGMVLVMAMTALADGKDNNATANFGGEIIRNQPISGTYTVKAGCTGTVRYTDGTQSDQFLSPDGTQVAFVLTNSPEFVGGGLEVQGTKRRVGD